MAVDKEVLRTLTAAVQESDRAFAKAITERDAQIARVGAASAQVAQRVAAAQKTWDQTRDDLKGAVEKAQAKTDAMTPQLDSALRRIADLEKRAGRPGAPGTAASAQPEIKTVGRQFIEQIGSPAMNDTLSALRRGARGSNDVYFGAEFQNQAKALLGLKAQGRPYNQNELVAQMKATIQTDAATRLTAPFRDTMLPLIQRTLTLRDFMPVRPVTGNSFEYIETTGLGPETGSTITTITSTGTAAIVTTAAAHGLRLNDMVEISGSDEDTYNGVFRVTGITSSVIFTYTLGADATDDTPAGTPLFRNMSNYGAAAGVAEGNAKPEARMKFDLKTGLIQVLAHWIPASRQVLDDLPELQAMIDNDLTYGVLLAEEQQLLYGSGSGASLQGILTHANRQTLTQGSFTILNALRRCLTLVQLAQQSATGFIVNPLDWEAIETVTGADEHYILFTGSGGADANVWRVPVLATKSIAPKDVLCGAFDTGSQLYDRQQVGVRFSEHHASYFTSNLLAVLAEERVGVAWKRPEGFVHLTLT